VPLTHLLEPMFYQEHPQKHEKVERVVQTSPFRFTREDIARRLDGVKAEPEGFHGPRITLAAPDMPPMGLSMERLAAGTKTRRYRSTANNIAPPARPNRPRHCAPRSFAIPAAS
jgi:gentisate 1,2-dioxygenase